jgi:hypothetical protein
MGMQPTGRRAARLAAIASVQHELERLDEAAQAEDWTEASAFNVDARNDEWRRLEDERRNTLADQARGHAPGDLGDAPVVALGDIGPVHEAMLDRMASTAMLARHGLGSRLGA